MINDQIKEIALANGFKLKEQPDGTQDLNPYVYEFARALFAEQQRLWNKERAAIELYEDWLESD